MREFSAIHHFEHNIFRCTVKLCSHQRLGIVRSGMPTIVGGWLKAKKRGRDDDAIERDRQEAMTKRRQRRKRQRRSTKDDFDMKSPPVSTQRSEKCVSPRIPLSCVPRRELFPNKKPSQRVARTERKTERKSYLPLKQYNEKNEHSEAFKTKIFGHSKFLFWNFWHFSPQCTL